MFTFAKRKIIYLTTMKILHISDTHGRHNDLTDLPEADILVHSGDFCFSGSDNEVLDFLNWFIELPYKHKIFIAGNHDDCLWDGNIEGLPDNCHFLRYSSVNINGIKFYGIPMFMQDYITGTAIKETEKIPTDTDVLITHCPPINILDFSNNIHYGSSELLATVMEIKPKVHLFGHIHASNGETTIGVTQFINSAMVDEEYSSLQNYHLLQIH